MTTIFDIFENKDDYVNILEFLSVRDIHALSMTCLDLKAKLNFHSFFLERLSAEMRKSKISCDPRDFLNKLKSIGLVAKGRFINSIYYGIANTTEALLFLSPKPIAEVYNTLISLVPNGIRVTDERVGSLENGYSQIGWVVESIASEFVKHHGSKDTVDKYTEANNNGKKSEIFLDLLVSLKSEPCRHKKCPMFGKKSKSGWGHFNKCYNTNVLGVKFIDKKLENTYALQQFYYGPKFDFEDIVFDGDKLHFVNTLACITRTTQMNWNPIGFVCNNISDLESQYHYMRDSIYEYTRHGFKFPPFFEGGGSWLFNYVSGNSVAVMLSGGNSKRQEGVVIQHKRKRFPDSFYDEEELKMLAEERKKRIKV